MKYGDFCVSQKKSGWFFPQLSAHPIFINTLERIWHERNATAPQFDCCLCIAYIDYKLCMDNDSLIAAAFCKSLLLYCLLPFRKCFSRERFYSLNIIDTKNQDLHFVSPFVYPLSLLEKTLATLKVDRTNRIRKNFQTLYFSTQSTTQQSGPP